MRRFIIEADDDCDFTADELFEVLASAQVGVIGVREDTPPDTRTTVTTPTPGAGRECPYCGMVWGHRRDCAVKR